MSFKVVPDIRTRSILPAGTASAVLANLFPEADKYLEDPVGWAHERMGAYLWSMQQDICRSVLENRYTAVKACHGPGKSFTAGGVLAPWWLDVHPFGEAFVVTTAPSWTQVQSILWREIRRTHRKIGLRGRITLECHWYMGENRAGEELIAMGRKPADYDEQAFQGIHARYVLVLIDEACGVPLNLYNAVLSLVTNENARVLAIGNPDDPNSYFADICKPGSGWNVITIPVWDTPNFTGEYVPDDLRQDLVSKQWVEDRKLDYGEGSPVWQAKIEAEFPDISDEYLFTPALIEFARNNELAGMEWGRYGADIARMGTDKTVVYRNRGGQIRLVDAWGKSDTMQTAGKLANIVRAHLPHQLPCMIDIIGVGAGVYDRLRERKLEVGGFQGSVAAFNFQKFKNRRAETYWEFRELMEAGGVDLDPKDDRLAADLMNLKWGIDSIGRIYVESKEDMRKRGVNSPDYADAAVLSVIDTGSVWRAGRGSYNNEPESMTGDLLARVM